MGIDTANPILFDHDGDGVKNATGWVKPDDGFLVLDRNGDGLINNGTELFGDSTPVLDADSMADIDLADNPFYREFTDQLDTSAMSSSVKQRIKCTESCTNRNTRRPHGNFSQRRDSPVTGSLQLF